MDELLGEFLTETSESLGTLDGELVRLEQEPDNPEIIDNIFRLVHTIKGTCGFLGLPRLEKVAHSSENVLGKIRDKELNVTADAVSLVLESLDQIKDILQVLEDTEAEPEGNDADLIGRLDLLAMGSVDAPAEPEPAPEPETPSEPEVVAEESAPKANGEDTSGMWNGQYDPDMGRDLKPGEVPLSELEKIFQETEAEEVVIVEKQNVPEPQVAAEAASASKGNADGKSRGESEGSVANQSIRVSVDLLENLMTMVSELVLTRNQLLQMVRSNDHDNSEFHAPLQQLSHVTTELQEGVMKTRMQPIGNAWAKLPRIIRDLSHELGKKIDLQMHGADTELDRQVLELIKDPLTHMVRNSADHGLEDPQTRLAIGKPELGTVKLNAFHEGGHIIIQIVDDGRGINVAKVRNKLAEKDLVSAADLETMTDKQIQQYIFHAGLSTAQEVTSVSGRGVGMDVVRTNIEKIGGTIDLSSEEGKGTTFTIKIPLTLAIVSALVIGCKEEKFAIPQLSVVELVRASRHSENKIENINNTPVLRLRNRLLPLVYLADALKLEDRTPCNVDHMSSENQAEHLEKLQAESDVFVVVTQVGNYTFGVVVDQVFDTEEIVVKPVAPLLRDISLFSGNTILGDGSVIMILDPNGMASTTSEVATAEDVEMAALEKAEEEKDENIAMLIFRAGQEEPKAVPLSLVARLEEIEVDAMEKSNGQLVVQYRGRLMPLIKFNDAYEVKTTGRQPVLVFSDDERSMGLIVDEIVDIVEEQFEIELSSAQDGFLGSAVVDGLATEIIDVGFFLTKAFKDWFNREETKAFGEMSDLNILLVDDSSFFRNMLIPVLEVSGFNVTAANDPDEAMRCLEGELDFDVIVSDIEMPNMNGFDFAEKVKSDDRWKMTPMIALSSHTAPKDFERGREVGFNDYVAKFDRDALLRTLSQTLHNGGMA